MSREARLLNAPPDLGAAAAKIPGVRYDAAARVIYGPPEALRTFSPIGTRVAGGLEREVPREVSKRLDDAAKALGLREYQLSGARRCLAIIYSRGGALLADEMGLGKTRTAVAVALALRVTTLLVVPASVRHQWCAELQAHGPFVAPTSGADFERLQPEKWTAGLPYRMVVSYGLVDQALDWMRDAGRPPTLAIFDEAHFLSDSVRRSGGSRRSSKRSSAGAESSAFAAWKLMLTGTPLPNRIRDMYRPLSILHGSATWGSAGAFDERYCDGRLDENGHWSNAGRSNGDELRERLAPLMVRRMKSDVAKELPPITRTFRWVEGTSAARGALHDLMTGQRSPVSYAAAVAATLDKKIPAAVEACREAGKFVCLTYLRAHAHQLAQELEDAGCPNICITGEMPPHARAAVIAKAEAEGLSVVATGASVGTGLNLQRIASALIMHSLDGKPADLAQREARLHRLGQANPVTVTYIAMRESIDERIANEVVAKLDDWITVIPGAAADQAATGLRSDISSAFTSSGGGGDFLKALFDSLPDGGDDGGVD